MSSSVQQHHSDPCANHPIASSVHNQTTTSGVPRPAVSSQQQIILPGHKQLAHSRSLPGSLNKCTVSKATDHHQWVAQSQSVRKTHPGYSAGISPLVQIDSHKDEGIIKLAMRKCAVNSRSVKSGITQVHGLPGHPTAAPVSNRVQSKSASLAKVVSSSMGSSLGSGIHSKYKIVKALTQPSSVSSPAVSPVKPKEQSLNASSILVPSGNPSFLSTPDSSDGINPSRNTTRVHLTSTPKDSSTLFQSKYKLVKSSCRRLEPPVTTHSGAMHNCFKVEHKNSQGNSGSQSKMRTRSFSRSRIVTQYKLVRSNWDLSKAHSSNRLLKKAVWHARKRKLSDTSLQNKHRRLMSVFKVDNTKGNPSRGTVWGKTLASPKPWVKKYSLRRESSG